ncbi:hypothetical protein OAW_01890 [Vibrio cyclitrophicus ZF170]|uniref:hypothetical protein n=1 Tax=Vibrio cyclitrophicus TaxID=47951 RepID=UPI0002F7BB05|nr:hypothetical protein [Vibrio cyclitrophicus]OBT04356.1 hypothetical protein A9265_17395 [Vibrio cyclitrophicus]OEE23128.1 hypothetical protein OAW_01890 [Vibrio cyclitrophicus ZF170]
MIDLMKINAINLGVFFYSSGSISLLEVKNMNKKTLIMTLVIGLMASIAFILIQPLFGMSTLTSRHAAAYVTLGGYDPTSALVLSWVVHVGVSLCYAFLSNLIFMFNSSLSVNLIQIAVLGWITTLIATPANEWVVKLVTTKQFPSISSLSALNTDVGPKLWLHILFFVLIVGGLWVAKKQRSAIAVAKV